MDATQTEIFGDRLLQLMDIAEDVGLEGDFEPLLVTFRAARDRVLKCGDEPAWRLLVHNVPPEDLPESQKNQLTLDAIYLHQMIKAVNVQAWMETLGGVLSQVKPSETKGQLAKAWDVIVGRDDYAERFDGRAPMRRWLKDSYAELTDPKRAAVRQEMDQAPTLGGV